MSVINDMLRDLAQNRATTATQAMPPALAAIAGEQPLRPRAGGSRRWVGPIVIALGLLAIAALLLEPLVRQPPAPTAASTKEADAAAATASQSDAPAAVTPLKPVEPINPETATAAAIASRSDAPAAVTPLEPVGPVDPDLPLLASETVAGARTVPEQGAVAVAETDSSRDRTLDFGVPRSAKKRPSLAVAPVRRNDDVDILASADMGSKPERKESDHQGAILAADIQTKGRSQHDSGIEQRPKPDSKTSTEISRVSQAPLDPARLAMGHLSAGRLPDAIAILDPALSASPNDPELAQLRARAALMQDNAAKAIAVLEGAAANAQRDAQFLALFAAAVQRMAQHPQAVALYSQALEIDSQRGAWWAGLAISLESTGPLDRARSAYLGAIEHGPLDPALQRFVESRLGVLKEVE